MTTTSAEQSLSLNSIEVAKLTQKVVQLLQQLIATPSFSKEEERTANLIAFFFQNESILSHRKKNNVWAKNLYYNPKLPTILLNSHHDTVRPNSGYQRNPFEASIEDGKLYGLGSNDAGGALVSLLAVFLFFYDKKLNYNLIFSATAEEEISGKNGIEILIPELGKIDLVIVGEPTKMNLAIAEKGLMVLDCYVSGTASHAAHENEDNAIYKAMTNLEKLKKIRFPKKSILLGSVKATVTQIEAGKQHNIVPDHCQFTIDVRSNECYSNEEILNIIQRILKADVIPRSTRLNSSRIEENHPFVQAAKQTGCRLYGSPTLSDQALLTVPSVKIGPGDSLRSHSADEFIYLYEIEAGIGKYIEIINLFFEYEN